MSVSPFLSIRSITLFVPHFHLIPLRIVNHLVLMGFYSVDRMQLNAWEGAEMSSYCTVVEGPEFLEPNYPTCD